MASDTLLQLQGVYDQSSQETVRKMDRLLDLPPSDSTTAQGALAARNQFVLGTSFVNRGVILTSVREYVDGAISNISEQLPEAMRASFQEGSKSVLSLIPQ